MVYLREVFADVRDEEECRCVSGRRSGVTLMAQVAKLPQFVESLMSALSSAFPGAKVDVQRIGRTNRYRLAVVWSNFKRMGHLQRQNRVWDVAEKCLSDPDLLRIG